MNDRGHGPIGVVALVFGLTAAAAVIPAVQAPAPRQVQFVFTSDPHYGITRPVFRGSTTVDAHVVNAAMIAQMNTLADASFPNDGGLKAGQPVGAMDFLAEGGDIANRSEVSGKAAIQSAAVSWSQFRQDYFERLALRTRTGTKAPVFVVPGNHDASNAVGFYKPMRPTVDKTAMVEIYNLMMAPARRTTATYDYTTDRILTSRDIDGVHFVFLTIWPDSIGRAWLARDLGRIDASSPVIVFTHDEPEAEAKHFTNPNGRHDINPVDRFENLLADAPGEAHITKANDPSDGSAWEAFVRAHPNIQAYFHGNSNWNEFYDWRGPRRTIALHTFRVDSPIKGKRSASDETKLSFQVATIDVSSRTMTVRECLWNTSPHHPSAPVVWGTSATVNLRLAADDTRINRQE